MQAAGRSPLNEELLNAESAFLLLMLTSLTWVLSSDLLWNTQKIQTSAEVLTLKKSEGHGVGGVGVAAFDPDGSTVDETGVGRGYEKIVKSLKTGTRLSVT